MATAPTHDPQNLFRDSGLFRGLLGASVFLISGWLLQAGGVSQRAQLVRIADKPQNGFEASEEQQATHASVAPPLIAGIIGTDPVKSDAETRATVWAFLRQAWKYDAAREGEWLLGVDEALEWLRGAAVSGAAVVEVETGFANLVADDSLPEAEREFALRHLGQCELSLQGAVMIIKLLCNVMEGDVTRPLCGAALMAVAEINPEDSKLWMTARRRALEMAANPSADVRNRTAAFEVAAARDWSEFEPVICERLCLTRQVSERVAAFEALVSIGGLDTLRWMETLPPEKDAVSASARARTFIALSNRWAAAPSVESSTD